MADRKIFENLIKNLSQRTKNYKRFEQYILLTNNENDEKYIRELKLVLPFLFNDEISNRNENMCYAYPSKVAYALDLQYVDENTIELYYPEYLALAQTPERDRLLKKFERSWKRYKKVRNKNATYDEVVVRKKGKAFGKNGVLLFEGSYKEIWVNRKLYRYIYTEGKAFYPNGNVQCEGRFNKYGIVVGKTFYENGQLRFKGLFNDKTKGDGSYYGPQYPLHGELYNEVGEQIYSGEFRIKRIGSMNYPMIVYPVGVETLCDRIHMFDVPNKKLD